MELICPSLQDLCLAISFRGSRRCSFKGKAVPDVIVAVPVVQIRGRVIERNRAPKILGNIIETVAVSV